jgi:tubulin polyglutamylase TTLL6/13
MQFQQTNSNRLRKQTYIAKPDSLSQGKGIFLSKNYDKIVRRTSDNEFGWVVQEYLDRPHLVEDLKYDLRIYVVLYGINPMRVFIHEKGLARFATEPYVAPKGSNMDNMFMHLTNYAINKNNEAFKENSGGGKGKNYDDYDDEDSNEESGHKRSLQAILKIIL